MQSHSSDEGCQVGSSEHHQLFGNHPHSASSTGKHKWLLNSQHRSELENYGFKHFFPEDNINVNVSMQTYYTSNIFKV